MAGQEGGGLQHIKADGAVTGGAVELAVAALADVTGSVGNLPAVDEKGGILAFSQCSAAGQGQVVSRIAITEP